MQKPTVKLALTNLNDATRICFKLQPLNNQQLFAMVFSDTSDERESNDRDITKEPTLDCRTATACR